MINENVQRLRFDASVPNVARIYDYLLGGKDNYAADRETADQLKVTIPDIVRGAQENRRFLGRAVRHLTRNGIDQFIDVGTGLPTQDNVHEVARKHDAEARVVYVDNDPYVIVHARALLAHGNGIKAIEGDLRDPVGILADPTLNTVIDLSRPVAVLLVAIGHFITEQEDLPGIIAQIRDAIAPGSYLALTHGTVDNLSAEQAEKGPKLYAEASAPFVPRTRHEVTRLFDGFGLIAPGVVDVRVWRPDLQQVATTATLCYGGVGIK